MTVGIDAKSDGILAKIIVGQYETANADVPIAVYAVNSESYMNYLANSMNEAADEARMADTLSASSNNDFEVQKSLNDQNQSSQELDESRQKQANASVQKNLTSGLLRAVRYLINSGQIDPGTCE
jgi:pyruvate/2-oxoglutarate dehydrogenase complex dihydrolipoamide acyltransferase (E2) component